MIIFPTSYLILLPGITAILNRAWRGEGNVPRYVWYSVMIIAASLACVPELLSYTAITWHDALIYPIWAIFFLGYALAPWQAMFSAVTGAPPGRRDGFAWDWMQSLAFSISRVPEPDYIDGVTDDGRKTKLIAPAQSNPQQPAAWYRFGMIYGAIRAVLIMPAVITLFFYTNSLLPLIGIAFLGMGCVYYTSRLAANHLQSGGIAVAIAEVSMGWFIGTYVLICAASLYPYDTLCK